MRAILDVVLIALKLYQWIIIFSAVFSLFYAFNVINPRNQFVSAIGQFLYQATEPALRPIRRYLPDLGTIDISPIVLYLGTILIELIIRYYIQPYVF